MDNPDRLLNTFDEIVFSDFKMPIICIYRSPEDYKGMYVARIFNVETPTYHILMRPTLEAIRSEIPERFSRVPNSGQEDLRIVETWI
ncbi:hypothetical protein LCM10_10535 [Rossellomorea aquimaris]|uniref:hypothetical protein n=1 Tax=Rossellomorea aquimaris TaxID=189382 RepID=UPI001CD1F9D0|nr:hypothetical protein [Rossellomorea aquimaris]MCA1055421.1 hypothetical protein [Rossellomorea aquimaris]